MLFLNITAFIVCRMLLAFSEQTKGKEFPENASDQEMFEIVMSRCDLLSNIMHNANHIST